MCDQGSTHLFHPSASKLWLYADHDLRPSRPLALWPLSSLRKEKSISSKLDKSGTFIFLSLCNELPQM